MDNTLRIWDLKLSSSLQSKPRTYGWFPDNMLEFKGLMFSPSGNKIVAYIDWPAQTGLTGGICKILQLWDTKSGKKICESTKGFKYRKLSFSSNEKWLATVCEDETIRLLDLDSFKEILVLPGWNFTISNDNHLMAYTGFWDYNFRVWNLDSCEEIALMQGHKSRVNCMHFSFDGHRIVSGSEDQTLRIWDSSLGIELSILKGHKESISSTNFSPNGKKIVSSSFDKTIRIWDTSDGKELNVINDNEQVITKIAYSLDGQYIISESEDKTVKIWNSETFKCEQIIHNINDFDLIRKGNYRRKYDIMKFALETAIVDVESGNKTAWFPEPLFGIITHPDLQTWAGSGLGSKHLYIVKLENFV